MWLEHLLKKDKKVLKTKEGISSLWIAINMTISHVDSSFSSRRAISSVGKSAPLIRVRSLVRIQDSPGGIAQLVERCLCKADVSGSSPLTSTKKMN